MLPATARGAPTAPRPTLTLVPSPAVERVIEQPATEAVAGKQTHRTLVTWAVGVTLGVLAASGLGVAGYLLGSSPLGAAIATGVVVTVAVLVAGFLLMTSVGHRIHCPGCQDC